MSILLPYYYSKIFSKYVLELSIYKEKSRKTQIKFGQNSSNLNCSFF